MHQILRLIVEELQKELAKQEPDYELVRSLAGGLEMMVAPLSRASLAARISGAKEGKK